MKPASVLDVGVGMGQYGFLLRTNLENVALFDIDGAQARQRPRERWGVVIDGIEGYAGYLTPVHHYAYNKVMIGDAMAVLPGIADGAYGLVLAIDILEHLSIEEGRQFLTQCRRIARRAALVSTPKLFMAQEVEANPLENHRSLWDRAMLVEAGYSRLLDNGESWIVIAE